MMLSGSYLLPYGIVAMLRHRFVRIVTAMKFERDAIIAKWASYFRAELIVPYWRC